jgi:hexosaminidase
VEYMIFPRMIALSEVLWSPKEKRNWKDFERRLPYTFERLEQQKINYSKAYYDLQATVLPTKDNDGVIWKIERKGKDVKTIDYNCTLLIDSIKLDSIYNSSGYIKPRDKTFEIASSAQTKEKEFLAKISFSSLASVNLFKSKDFFKDQILLNKKLRSLSTIEQNFFFNKATGKKITLVNEPHKSYPGDGAFTLVNGVQNEKGMARSNEFVGFSGNDLDATIDLGKDMEVSKITIHCFAKNNSWIYLPSQIEVWLLNDTITSTITLKVTTESKLQIIQLPKPKTCRYINLGVKNYGTIPAGKPGAGEKAWLFVDEIEVE